MTLSFVVDANLPERLARWLRTQGFSAVHVHELGIVGTEDENILAYAAQMGAIVISRDKDFRNLVNENGPARLLWVKWGNTSRKVLFERLSVKMPAISAAFKNGEWLVELSDR
jgi:predicted nuclease of predicted toxin-antitoxin system